MLACSLFTSTLYGHPAAGATLSADVSTMTEAGSFMPAPAVPTAPSGLTATAVSSSRIDLAWTDNSGDETGFKIERKTGAAGTYVQIATVGTNVTSFSNISGLSPNTQYFYRVRANNASGNSTFSNEASATTLAGPPAAPSGLTATAMSSSKINLAWTDNSGDEDGFKIERKTGAGGTYVQIATVGANVTSFSNSSGLSPNTEYFYHVRAYNANGNSAFSNEASATTLAGAPIAPSGLTATAASSSKIDLAWTDNSGDEDGFKIERKLSSETTFTEIATVGANVTNFSSTGLSPNTAYTYRVRAYNASGSSAYSNEASATTLRSIPAKPLNLTATAVSNSQINLAWTDNSGNEDGFKIERKTGAAGTYAEIATVGTNVTSFSGTGLAGNTEYFYRARAFNNGGNSAYSNEANATTLPEAPAAPNNLAANAVSGNQIDLAWADNSGNEDGFKIERKTGVAGTYAVIATVGANVTSYSSTGLSPSTEYFYRVRAFNSTGNSIYSNEANATTLTNIPAAPNGLAATAVSKSQINLAWTDNSNNEDGFKIERKLSSATSYTEIAAIGPNATSYSSTGLATNTAYSFRVRAYNVNGNSAYSNEASTTTFPNPPAAPSNLIATVMGVTQIDLAWVDNSGNELGFIIERKTGADGTYADVDTVGANQTSYSNTGLSGGLQYFYKVRAYNVGGNSARSNEASGTTPPAPPAAPSNLTANAVSSDQIDLAWTDQASNETGFTIELKIGPAGTYAEIDTVAANVTSYSSTGLDASTQYFYRVRALNSSGPSSYSNEANATTLVDPPAAPSALTATTVSYAQINLTWTDNANNETGFKIERKLSSATSYTQVATVGANVTTYSNISLAANTAYSYRVRAYNSGGNSPYSNIASATTFPNPPPAPSGLTATVMSSAQIDLAWQDNASNEDGFKIERKTDVAGTYAEIATVGANQTAFSSTGLTGGFQYFYRVRAYNAGGNSAYSNEANATPPPGPPAAPGNLTATAVSNNQINLTWTDFAIDEEGFTLEIKIGSSGTYTEIDTVAANVTSYSNTGLDAGTQYFYRVRAFNSIGNSSYSNEANATTQADIPTPPSNLTATTVSNTQINLAWTDNSSTEDGFKIERKLSSGTTYTQVATVSANVTSYANTGLAGNTAYSYRVRAYNSGGNSSYSNIASATTLPNPPAAPSVLAATAVSNSQINLSWQDNASTELGFKIERKTGAAGTYAQIALVGANVTSYSNSGLTGNTQYFYRVRAYNAGGHSAFSNEANATTLPNSPVAPNGLTATAISNTQINLAWADSSDNEDGFKIERKIGAAGTYTQVATVDANVTAYSNTGLSATTIYFYRVRAYNAGGHSEYSDEANATTLPNPPITPGSLTATTVSQTQINLAWADSSNNEEGFKIERKTGAAGTYAQIATVGANVTSYSDNGLSANTAYFYRVRAHNVGGNSGYSNEANATTLPNPPVAPDSLTATTASSSQIDLAWANNADNENGFKIERKTGAAGTYAQIATVGANVTTYSNTGLTANTAYFYRVRAYNTGGNSAYSTEANATTFPTPPKAPGSLTATPVSQTQINLAWVDSSNNETGFKIERKKGAAGTFGQIATVGANATSYSNTALTANTEYFYRVRAYNAGGNSTYSSAVSATTLPNPPKAPAGLTATTVSSSQINLTWADSSNNEDGFKIERKTGVAGTYAEIGTVGVNVTSYSSTALSPTTQYFYRVRAYNTGGNSSYSNAANATTLPLPPEVPSNLAATALSQTQINLTWTDNADNEIGFKIERKTGAAGTYAEVGTVGVNVTNYSDTGLSANTEYFYRILAHNTGGNSAYSNEANVTTLPNAPTAPSSLAATPVSNTQIDLNWTDTADNEAGFKIERKTGAAGTYAEIGTVGANVTNYSDSGLAGNTQYFYRVRAHNAGGNSNYSTEANATTLPNPPAAPGNLTATTVSSSQINLAWTDSTNNEDGFRIERKKGVAGTYAEIGTVGANVTSFASTGLSPNSAYFYRIRAYNVGGNSPYSTEASATTLPAVPAKPSNLIATTVSNTQIDLTWTDGSTNESGFKIERKTGAAGTYSEIGTVGANVTSFSSLSLVANTQYFYRVRAFNAGGNSAFSNEANATTLPNPPSAPGSLIATTVSNTQINLAWADSANNEAGFKIERKTGAAGTYAEVGTVGANVTNFSDTGLSGNTQYFYRVRAFNAGGNSAYSGEANATTLPNPPSAPSSLAVTPVSTSQINLNWTDNANNEDGFKIERKTGAAGTYAEVATVGANVTNFSDTGLTLNTEYFYRVRAHNAGGNSAYSNEANATTLPNPPAAPSSMTATTVSNSQIDLNWTDNADNEVGFKIERKTGAAGSYVEVATVGANVTNYSNTGLSQSTEYFYRVRAYNTGGNSAYSNEASATTVPKAPAGLTATAISNTQINLAWADSAATETGFKVERKTGAAGTYAEIATLTANTTAYSDTGLTANTQYFYRVRAFNTGGNSAYSNEANATTLPNPPTAPSSLTASAVSTNQINLAWTDNASDETGFKIERKTGAAGTYAEIATVGANVTSYSSTGLVVNTTYYYRVRATNAGGNSTYSNEANATTPSGGNLALNKPITASSTDSTSAASRAVDGSATTFWRSNFVNASSPPEWLRVELDPSSNMPIGRAVVTWYQNYNATEYEFQLSTDGTNWTTVYTNNAGTLGTQDFTFTTTMARFVRLYMKKNAKSNYRVAELEVYAGSLTKDAASSAEAANVPTTITLAQNYPNPFNPSTTISYSLPEGMHVALKILNIAGQEVATLADGYQGRGIYRMPFNAAHLPSGVYFAVLKAGEVVQTRRMILTK